MSDQILDLPEFLERVQDDKELLIELLGIYQEDYTVKRPLLEAALKVGNAEEVRNIAHSLKGASGNISAKAVRDILMHLENMGKNKTLTGGLELVQQLDVQYKLLAARMDVIRQELAI